MNALGADPHDPALVAAMVAMADALDLVVKAEDVETNEQLAILNMLRCGRTRGFLLARPMPAADMDHLICESRSGASGSIGAATGGRNRVSA